MKLNDKKMIIGFTIFPSRVSLRCKVENILKHSLDSIPSPSPSVKIQIIGGKVGKTLLGVVNKLFGKNQKWTP